MSSLVNQTAKALLDLSTLEVSNYRKYRQQSGQNFNIFKLIDRHTCEVQGHSAFISEFLSPTGMHGQGDIFLKMFFKVLGIDEQVKDFEKWRVLVETGKDVDGRIDILLIGVGSDGSRFGIAIENKIYASLQKRQLGRYYEFLVNKFGGETAPRHWLLYYLTLNEDEPSRESLGGIPSELLNWKQEGTELDSADEAAPEGPVRLLSYSDGINGWMAQCRDKLSSFPYAREVVSQYIETINVLTGNGGSMPRLLMEQLKTPEKFEAAIQLSKAADLARIDLVQNIWRDIKTVWDEDAKMSIPANGKNCNALCGTLEPNIKAGSDMDKLMALTRNFFVKKKVSAGNNYFGLSSKSYAYENSAGKTMSVWLEIRFNGRFYAALYGENEVSVHSKDILANFYTLVEKDYETPDKKKINALKKPDRIILFLKDSIDFRNNSAALYELLDKEKRYVFARDLVGMAKTIVKEMNLKQMRDDNFSL